MKLLPQGKEYSDMGKKIPFDQALQMGLKNPNDSIYTQQNKYGYRINVNHPQIKPLYERYKRHIKAIILSDVERFRFESMIFQMIEKRKNNERDT